MDQVKIGRFIAERRKQHGLTQMQLAEKLGITDRAVSKWENGKGMPDSSLMLDLCRELEITVNELLCGEVIEMTNYDKKAEEQLLQMAKEKEKRDKELLQIEIFIGILVSVILIACIFIASFVKMDDIYRIILIAAGTIPFVIGIGCAIRIEQVAGYYECRNCGHKYVPEFRSVLFSMHTLRSRHMKCPECGEKSWQKKVISK